MDSSTNILLCAKCGYDLSGTPVVDERIACPECGLKGLVRIVGVSRQKVVAEDRREWNLAVMRSVVTSGLATLMFACGWPLSAKYAVGVYVAAMGVAMGVAAMFGAFATPAFLAIRVVARPRAVRQSSGKIVALVCSAAVVNIVVMMVGLLIGYGCASSTIGP
jgi:DNA-directed RNA polymerase subunit RPC12/RpoP